MAYAIEVTDTFGGEANYTWVERFVVHAKSELGAIRIAGNRTNYRFRSVGGGRYDARGACVCAFVEWCEDDATA
jgi:hypothetical protein